MTLAADVISPVYVDNLLAATTATYSISNRNAGGADGYGFPTLALALESLASGTVYIRAGTYQEHLTVSKNMVIAQHGSEEVIVDGSDSNVPAFDIQNSCTMRGLKIKGSQALGEGAHFSENNVSVSNGAILTIEDCELYNFNHCGIKVTDGRLFADNLVIRDGGWTFLDHGIYLAAGDAGGHEIANSEMYGCTGWGIHAYAYEYDALISGNNIHDNFGGIVVTGEGHQVLNNVITDNLGGKGINFFHYGLIDLVVTGNQCSGNTSHDLYLDAGEGEGFTNCTIENNTGTKNF